MTYSAPVIRTPMPVESQEDAHVLLARLETSMEGLIELIEVETRLVREGKLFAASELESRKTEYAQAYVELMESARKQEQVLHSMLPENLEKLRHRHEDFKALLQMNLTALQTARDVTRNLIQGVAKKMGQSEAPTTYSAYGQVNQQPKIASPGLTLDKSS